MSDNILWIPALIVLLGTLVFFHELGHFTLAKLFRIRVDEFAFGFGPRKIVLFKRGDTEYTIHPIPLGGFVKLAGGEPGEEDVPNGFLSKPWWTRWLVFLAGPTMSFLLAYLIFSTLGVAFGLPKAINRIDTVLPNSRAAHAGLKPGDVVVKIDNNVIDSGEEMVNIVHNSIGKELTIVIDRNGQILTLKATPGSDKIEGKRVGLLGFTPVQVMERAGVVESVKVGTSETTKFIKLTLQALFSRDVGKNVGGPIAIAQATRASVKGGLDSFLFLMAILSLSLGIINLMPIPIVDGGQMMLLVVEGIKGKRLSRRTLEIAQTIGLATIATLFLLIMYLDINRLFSQFKVQ